MRTSLVRSVRHPASERASVHNPAGGLRRNVLSGRRPVPGRLCGGPRL